MYRRKKNSIDIHWSLEATEEILGILKKYLIADDFDCRQHATEVDNTAVLILLESPATTHKYMDR